MVCLVLYLLPLGFAALCLGLGNARISVHDFSMFKSALMLLCSSFLEACGSV